MVGSAAAHLACLPVHSAVCHTLHALAQQSDLLISSGEAGRYLHTGDNDSTSARTVITASEGVPHNMCAKPQHECAYGDRWVKTCVARHGC
jgi:hypothetical protein